ncbi:hypothetical protein FOXYSP1_06458 [Fusarium oxysporum f. sp. phaseoli]
MPCRLTDSAEEYTCGLGFFLANGKYVRPDAVVRA